MGSCSLWTQVVQESEAFGRKGETPGSHHTWFTPYRVLNHPYMTASPHDEHLTVLLGRMLFPPPLRHPRELRRLPRRGARGPSIGTAAASSRGPRCEGFQGLRGWDWGLCGGSGVPWLGFSEAIGNDFQNVHTVSPNTHIHISSPIDVLEAISFSHPNAHTKTSIPNFYPPELILLNILCP